MIKRTSILFAASISLTALAAPAVAQARADAASAAAADESEIVVTANKREERLRDVPASVSAVSGDTLKRIGATRLEDYVARVPGLILENTGFANGANQLTIRGLNTGQGANPTVGIYIDDLPYGGSNTNAFGGSTVPDLDPMDLARVEVLRGPQGTLYGAGSLGGLFKYVTAAPDPSHAFGRVEANGQSVDGGGTGFGLRGAANLPVSGAAAIRVSGFYREDPGFIDNVTTGKRDVNSARVYGGRASLLLGLGEGWSLRGSAMLQRQKADGNAIEDHTVAFPYGPSYGEYRQARAPSTGRTGSTIQDYTLTITGDLGFATLTSASGYNPQKINFNLDVTAAYSGALAASGIPGAGVAIITDASLKKFSQELRLASSSKGAITWLLGGFYTHEHALTHQYFSAFTAATGAPYPVTLPTLLDAYVDSTFEEVAGFGNVTWAPSKTFDVTAGIRYSHNRQSRTQSNSGVFIGTGSVDSRSSDSSVTYLLTPRLHLDANSIVYARFATGYRPGGPNNPVPGTPASYSPDTTTNYEVGYKTEFGGGRLSFDIAAYWIDWSDIQLNLIVNGLNFNGNGGKARSRGVESSLLWRPLSGLSIDGNVSYNDAVLTQALPPGPAAAAKGARLPSVPRWTAQASADYEFPISSALGGLVGASVRYIGRRIGYFTDVGEPRYPLGAYTVADLRAGVSFDKVRLDVFVKNVGNTHGEVAAYTLGPDRRVSVIQPRTLMVSLSSRF